MQKRSAELFLFLLINVIIIAGCNGNDGATVVTVVGQLEDRLIKAVSFNIHHDADNWDGVRKDLVKRFIEIEEPDIIGLQEAYGGQVYDILGATIESVLPLTIDNPSGYEWVHTGRDEDGGGEGVPILYKSSKFGLLDSGTFWFSNRPDVPGTIPGRQWGDPTLPRICTWVRLKNLATGQPFYVYNLHLQHNEGSNPPEARQKSVELLVDRVKARPGKGSIIIMGDFNMDLDQRPAQFTYKYLIGNLTVADVWAELFPDDSSGTRCLDGESGVSNRLDYIFTGPGMDGVGMRIGSTINRMCPSDHSPIIADIIIP